MISIKHSVRNKALTELSLLYIDLMKQKVVNETT